MDNSDEDVLDPQNVELSGRVKMDLSKAGESHME
jgi:hypothetical protein